MLDSLKSKALDKTLAAAIPVVVRKAYGIAGLEMDSKIEKIVEEVTGAVFALKNHQPDLVYAAGAIALAYLQQNEFNPLGGLHKLAGSGQIEAAKRSAYLQPNPTKNHASIHPDVFNTLAGVYNALTEETLETAISRELEGAKISQEFAARTNTGFYAVLRNAAVRIRDNFLQGEAAALTNLLIDYCNVNVQ